MVKARKYRGQGPGGSGFSALNIGYGPVQRMEERNRDLEGKLSKNLEIEERQRAAFLTHMKGNQELERANREQVFDFNEESRRKVADAKFANNRTEVANAEAQYQSIVENGTALSQLAQFSETLGKTISEVKQDVQKRNFEDQYYKTYQDLTTGDVMATRAAEASLNNSQNTFRKAAQAAEASGVPFEYARQLEGLGGSRKLAAAKAVAEVASSRFPAYLKSRLSQDDQTVITYRDQFTGEEKQITPQAATSYSETMAVGQAILKDYLGQTGITNIQPALVASFIRQMDQAVVDESSAAQGREQKIYEQTQSENFTNELRTELLGNGLTTLSMKQQIDKLATLKNPQTGVNYTPNQALTRVVNTIVPMAAQDTPEGNRIHAEFKAYANSQGPEGLAPEGVTNAEYFPNIVGKALDDILRLKDDSRDLQEEAEKNQVRDKVSALVAADKTNPLSSQEYREFQQQLANSELGFVPDQLKTLIAEAERREMGVPQLMQEAQELAERNELTSEKLKMYPPEISSNPVLQQKTKLADAVAKLSAPGTPSSKSLKGNVTQIYKALTANPSLTAADGLSQFTVKEFIEADILDRAQELMISEPNMSAERAISKATQELSALIQSQTTGLDDKGRPQFKDINSPYYYDTKTGRFPNIEGPNFVDNFDRIEDQADVYLKAPEDLATHVFIPEKILKDMQVDGAPIHPIVGYLRDKLGKKGKELSDFDILNPQLELAGEKPRKLPQAQVTFEAQNPTPQQKELLNYLPTGKRTTRASMDMGMNANTEREAVRHIASRMGIDPLDIAAIIDFETANALTSGAYRSGLDQWGGANMDGSGRGSFLGWIQFSPDNQRQFDVRTGLTAMQHAEKVVQYLTANGVQPGDPLHVVYQAIQAPAYVQKARATGRTYSADINGTVAGHVNQIRARRQKVQQWFSSGNVNPYADPRAQSSSSAPYDNI